MYHISILYTDKMELKINNIYKAVLKQMRCVCMDDGMKGEGEGDGVDPAER